MTIRFTREQLDAMVARYKAGETANALGRAFNCSITAIKNNLRKEGVYDGQRPRAGAKFTPDERRDIVNRYEAGESIYVLSKAYGFSPNGLWKMLKSYGVEMRFHGKVEGRKVKHGEYVSILADRTDPIASSMAWANGYVLEHRLVLARALGRPLTAAETVHHINGDVKDNRPANLQLRNGRHGKGVVLQCSDCGSHNVAPAQLA